MALSAHVASLKPSSIPAALLWSVKEKFDTKVTAGNFWLWWISTPECEKAIHYAARRVAAIDADLVLIYVIEPGDFQHWLGVEDVMRAEARAEAEAALAKASAWAVTFGGITPPVGNPRRPARCCNRIVD